MTSRDDNIARCGYTVIDDEGIEQPCDRPAPHWRWYQDTGEHEDVLDAACDWHSNDGGQRIHAAEAERDIARREAGDLRARLGAVEAGVLREVADEADSIGHHWSGAPALAFFALAGDLHDRAALANPSAPDQGASG